MVAVTGNHVNGSKGEVTRLLDRFRAGDREAESRLIPLVYRELRRIAAISLSRERKEHSLDPTELVHEAFLRMTAGTQPQWHNRSHFFAVSAHLMRQILVDYARHRSAAKRGGAFSPLPVDSGFGFPIGKSDEMLALDEALSQLASQDERQSKIVEMKFFGGLSIEEIAEVMALSPRTVKREWTSARAWLRRQMTRSD